MKLKINWKLRLQNPMFYMQVILSFFIPVLGYLGLNWSEITTWASFFDMVFAALNNPYCLSIAALSVFNAIVDSSSPGINDSQHVLCLKCLFSDCPEHEVNKEKEEPKEEEK